jgi:hypothetical protein
VGRQALFVMYNFRYHLITIISIFAALALGLLLGVAITGSDLVRDASNNLAESLTEQFDELNTTNQTLNNQLQTQQVFSDGLLVDWQKERFKGRTIVILTRASEADESLTKELSALVTQCGGSPVTVRIDPTKGFALEDESMAAELKQILPEIEGESYETTLARALVAEWSFTIQEGESSISSLLETNYPLTTLLVEKKIITITTAYQPVFESTGTIAQGPSVTDATNTTDAAEAADATDTTSTADTTGVTEAADATGMTDGADVGLEGNSDAVTLAQQRSAYESAERLQLPYRANGVIDTAVFAQAEGGRPVADPVALQIALAFDQKGMAGELSYQHPGMRAVASSDTAQESSTTNYYALLVQQDDAIETMTALSRDVGLPCEISPLEPMGRYGVVALLSGAEKGIYGLGYDDVTPFPSVPSAR